MSIVNRANFRLSIGFALVAQIAMCTAVRAQNASQTGLVDDWSHHHVVLSTPVAEKDAVASGHYNDWLKVVNSPRYIMQQEKRKAPIMQPTFVMPLHIAPAPAGDVGAPVENDWSMAGPGDGSGGGPGGESGEPGFRRRRRVHRPVSPMKTDWSMSNGALSAASLTVTVSSAPASGTVSGTSTITVDGQTFTGSAPVAEVYTVAFSIITAPAANSYLTIGSTRYTFEATPLTAPATGCYVAAAAYTTGATDLENAVNTGGAGSTTTFKCATGVGANSAVTATLATATVTLTAKTAGSVGFTFTPNGTTNTTNTETKTPSDGTNSATTFKYTTSSAYDTQAQLATDLAAAFGDNATLTAAVTAAASTNKVVLSAVAVGTSGNSLTATDSGFTALTLANSGDFSGGGGGIPANTYPAKFSFSTTTASCSDYVVYPTGASGSNATLIAYSNIYVGTCATPNPKVAWAYNTGGTSTLSPVLSLDGAQVAYVQTSSGIASLVLLKPSLTSGGTLSAPATASLTSLGSYRTCTAPCYVTIPLSGAPNDTNSSPFYVYSNADTLYVGDNSGKVHKFTGVFKGTPAEASTGGWPVTASVEPTTILTSPIYDAGTSQLIFVGDSSGYLHSVTTTGASSQTVLTSNQMECGTGGFVDAPIVDSSTENVYAFVGDGCDGTPGNSHINRFAAGTAISASFGANNASFGNASTNNTSTVLHVGAFDNAYFLGTGTTGNIYACENGVLYKVPMSTLSGTGTVTVSKYNTAVSTVSSASTCSGVTEFYNGTQDWLFMSVIANGNATGCTGACLYNYNVQGAGATGTATTGQAAAGGTTAVVIDNSLSGAGESQIYYTTLSNQACTGNGTTGSGTGTCAIQTSQSVP